MYGSVAANRPKLPIGSLWVGNFWSGDHHPQRLTSGVWLPPGLFPQTCGASHPPKDGVQPKNHLRPQKKRKITTTDYYLHYFNRHALANPAQVMFRSTCTVLPCSFMAKRKWAADIICVKLIELVGVQVPCSFLYLPHFKHMHAVCIGPKPNRQVLCLSTSIGLVVSIFLRVGFEIKYKCRCCQLLPCTGSSLPCIHLCNQPKDCLVNLLWIVPTIHLSTQFSVQLCQMNAWHI